MVALAPTKNETYIPPSPYAWLRSRASVPTTYAPACEPLSEFNDVLKNRTSRARGVTSICTGFVLVSCEAATSYVVMFLEVRTILYNGEGIESRTGLYNFRARWYSASNGRFERLDPYAGNPNDPFSFNKYGFVHGDPVQGIDPTGLFSLGGMLGGFSIGQVIGAISFGAALGAGAKVWSNFALDRPLTEGLGYAALFGGITLPLSILLPPVGIALAAVGFGGAINLNYEVWTNPRSTNGQKGAASFLLFASVVGGGQAIGNARTNGWFNGGAFRPASNTVQTLLNSQSRLGEFFPEGTPDSAMIHLTASSRANFSGGVARAFCVKFGEVKDLTLAHYKEFVAGPGARAFKEDATIFVVIRQPIMANFTERGSVYMGRVTEYLHEGNTLVNEFVYITENPQSIPASLLPSASGE